MPERFEIEIESNKCVTNKHLHTNHFAQMKQYRSVYIFLRNARIKKIIRNMSNKAIIKIHLSNQIINDR